MGNVNNYKHGQSQTRLWILWTGMKTRVRNRPKYAALGMCQEWYDFEVFKKWSLENGYDEHLTLDRIDNFIGYWPENCRWTTNAIQQRNRVKTLKMTAFGETKSVIDWSEDSRCKVSYRILIRRHYQNWDPEKALTLPPKHARQLMSRSDNRLSSVMNPTGKLPASVPVEDQSA